MIYQPEPDYCEHEGCQAEAQNVIHCYISSWEHGKEDDHYHYCVEHAPVEGFCSLCGWFALGSSERFEFGPYKGLCDNCKDEVQAEEYDEDDDDGMYNPYFDDDQYDNDYFDYEHEEA